MTDVATSETTVGRTVRVVLTHAEGRLERLPARLRALGFDVVHRPSIAVRPRVDESTRDAAAALLELPWLLFASRSAVDAWARLGVGFARRAAVDPEPVRPSGPTSRPSERASPLAPRTGAPRIGAVGPGTAAALRAAGARVDLVAEPSTAEGLAAVFAQNPAAAGPVGLAQGSRARPTLARRLADAGYETRAAVLYDTDEVPWEDGPEAHAGSFSATVVVVASPSAVASLARGWRGEGDADAWHGAQATLPRFVAIGPTTAAAVRALGEPCWVAETADVDGIVTAVLRAVANEKSSGAANEKTIGTANDGRHASDRAARPATRAASPTRPAGPDPVPAQRGEVVDDGRS